MTVAYIFPGQGSQFAGMGRELAERFSAARDVFAEADDALGFSLSQLCFEGPAEALQLTENTQPAILAVSVAALTVYDMCKSVSPAISITDVRLLAKSGGRSGDYRRPADADGPPPATRDN